MIRMASSPRGQSGDSYRNTYPLFILLRPVVPCLGSADPWGWGSVELMQGSMGNEGGGKDSPLQCLFISLCQHSGLGKRQPYLLWVWEGKAEKGEGDTALPHLLYPRSEEPLCHSASELHMTHFLGSLVAGVAPFPIQCGWLLEHHA